MRICLVTEELATFGTTGGIGAAFLELSIALSRENFTVDLHYFPTSSIDVERKDAIIEFFSSHGVKVYFIDGAEYVWNETTVQSRSYAVYNHLKDNNIEYEFLHFHDYKGLGFFCCQAKKQGIAFKDTLIVTQLHGPTRWTIHANRTLFTHPDQLTVDFLERESIRLSDRLISPSLYLLDWLGQNGYQLPGRDCISVIKNVRSHCESAAGFVSRQHEQTNIKEIIYFGRHEPRKGIVEFCASLDILNETLAEKTVKVSFLGNFGEINGKPSGLYLTDRAAKWDFPIEFLVGLNRAEAIRLLRERQNALVVIPSRAENSPYTLVEAIATNNVVLTSIEGGAKELLADWCLNDSTVKISPRDLALRMNTLLARGAEVAEFSETSGDINSQWMDFHYNTKNLTSKTTAVLDKPSVVVGITHYERPEKVIAAIASVLRQTYDNLTLVVLDDGSERPETLVALSRIEKFVTKLGGRYIRQENSYLGAARNRIANETNSDFILFLDDDDILLPDAIEKLMSSALHSGADITNCLNIFMDEDKRSAFELFPENHGKKVSYIPIGGPLSLAHLGNHFGAATALIKRSLFNAVGGYTEIKNVGFEDYEFYVRVAQMGGSITVVPEPLYLYEVGRPSMVSSTMRLTNKLRVLEHIDFTKDSQHWRDAVEVAAGHQTVEEQLNHFKWTTSISNSKNYIEAVVGTTGSILDHVRSLIHYARSNDLSYITQAWERAEDALGKRAEAQAKPSARRLAKSHLNALRTAVKNEGTLVADMALSLKVGRPDEALEFLILDIEKHGRINDFHVEAAFSFAALDLSNTVAAKRLIEILQDSPADLDLHSKIRGAIVAISVSADLLGEGLDALNDLLRTESEEYLIHNPDVASAFKDEPVGNALIHYMSHGLQEHRRGFEVAARISDAVSKRLRRLVGIADLRSIFNRMPVAVLPLTAAKKENSMSSSSSSQKMISN